MRVFAGLKSTARWLKNCLKLIYRTPLYKKKKFLKKNYTSYTRQRNLLNLLGVSGVGSVVFFQKLFFVVV